MTYCIRREMKDLSPELETFLRLSEEANKKIEKWPEWKKALRLTKYSEGFGAKETK